MARVLVSFALAALMIAPGCTSTQAPIARRVGMVASIGGVVGLTAGAAASRVADTETVVAVFSLISAIGIGLYAAGELTDPHYAVEVETTTEKHHRWARILTERAFRYAREGNCKRVRRVEKRVFVYDRELHDFVFLRDEAIAACMSAANAPTPPEATGNALPLAPTAIDPAGDQPPSTIPPPTIDPAGDRPPSTIPPPANVAPPVLPPPSSVRDPADP